MAEDPGLLQGGARGFSTSCGSRGASMWGLTGSAREGVSCGPTSRENQGRSQLVPQAQLPAPCPRPPPSCSPSPGFSWAGPSRCRGPRRAVLTPPCPLDGDTWVSRVSGASPPSGGGGAGEDRAGGPVVVAGRSARTPSVSVLLSSRIIDQRFEKVSYFVFGDFNFRLDAKSVVEVGSWPARPEPSPSSTVLSRQVQGHPSHCLCLRRNCCDETSSCPKGGPSRTRR